MSTVPRAPYPMATVTSSPSARSATTLPAIHWRRVLPVALAALLVGVLAVNLPGFVRSPLDSDATLWDLFARSVLAGGVPYRDAFDNNLPGMLWAHMAIRSLFGWRPEVLRLADAGVVAAIVFVLLRWLPAGCPVAWRLFSATALTAFYLSTSEWCHCQRDTWMLLPALLAAGLRWRQVLALAGPRAGAAALVRRGLAEGVLWGAACWFKPFAAVPCLCCWLVAARQVGAVRPGSGRRLALDGTAVFTGGLLAGVAGCAWLLAAGAWSDFWDVMLVWNGQYVRFAMGRDIGWAYYLGPAVRLAPWPLVHLAAVPVAAAVLWRRASARRQLLAALYLGWLAQAALLQHVYDYVHVPPLILGIALLCQQAACAAPGLAQTLVAAVLILGIAVRLPAANARRLDCWAGCFQSGSPAALHDRLRALPQTSWEELDRVREFLTGQGVGDGELTCLSMRTAVLYNDLGVGPSTRYFFLENVLQIFAAQRERVFAEMAASRQRFLVCDVTTTRWRKPGDFGRSADEPYARRGLLFRAGRYAVYSLSAAEAPAWIRENLDL